MSYVRLSVPVDRDTVAAARRLREWVNSPGFADFCAGATVAVGTLERIVGAVNGLRYHLDEMVEVARGERYLTAEGPPVDYLFRWIAPGGGSGGVIVRWRSDDVDGARALARQEIEQYPGAELSKDDPAISPIGIQP